MSTIPVDTRVANPDPLDPNPVEGKGDPVSSYVAVEDILTNYLEPDSTLSLENAIDQVCQIHSKGAYERDGNCHVQMQVVSISTAERMPYDHPSHKKLAEFMVAWYESEKWLTRIQDEKERERAKFVWLDQFSIYYYDSRYTPDIRFQAREIDGLDDEPIYWANFCAFDAHYIYPSRGKWNTRFAKYSLDDALKIDPMATMEVRDAWVIGAAQYIIYQAPAIFDEVLLHQQRKAEREKFVNSLIRWITCDRQPKWDEEAKFGMKDWQAWKCMFRAAAVDEKHGKTCQDVAQNAADLMALQEKIRQDEISA